MFDKNNFPFPLFDITVTKMKSPQYTIPKSGSYTLLTLQNIWA